MRKRIRNLLALTLALLMAAACLGTAALAAEKPVVKVYGLIVEYAPVEAMLQRVQEKLGDKYDFEFIQVDWGNLESVISTGIASGAPCDIYTYWPQDMQTFVKAGQALDLTPYLEANDGEWKNTFVQAQLDTGLIDGKYWAVPLDGTYQMAMVNKSVFDELGIEINPTWTWDEFMADCETIKASGKFPFALWRDGVEWLWKNTLTASYVTAGKIDDYLGFNLPKDDPALSALLDRAKLMNDNGYWYPGVGGVNSARDEARASFVNGDSAVLFEMASLYNEISGECDFEVVPVCWPSDGATTVNVGGTDGFFIPSNAKNPDAAVEVLKVLLDAESQAMLPAAGIIPSSSGVEITDPSLEKLVDLSQYMWSRNPPSKEFNDYMKQELIAGYVLGAASKDDVLNGFEAICEAVKAAQ